MIYKTKREAGRLVNYLEQIKKHGQDIWQIP